jgi:hypothetical protein
MARGAGPARFALRLDGDARSRQSEQNRLNQQHGGEGQDETKPDGRGESQHLRPSNFDHPSQGRRKQVPPRTSQEQDKASDCDP